MCYIPSIHNFMYYFSLIPNINFTIPLKHFGTFFTTIVILFTLLFISIVYLQDNHISPTIIIVTPITNNQPDKGSNNTSKIPNPNPIKHTPNVFFSNPNIVFYSPLSLFIYSIPSFSFLLPLYVFYK